MTKDATRQPSIYERLAGGTVHRSTARDYQAALSKRFNPPASKSPTMAATPAASGMVHVPQLANMLEGGSSSQAAPPSPKSSSDYSA